MAELENTNPIMDNPEESPINPAPEVNAANLSAEPVTAESEQAPDFSQLFSESIADSTPIQESQQAPSVDTVNVQPSQETATPVESTSQPSEAPVQEQPVNFEQEIAHTSLDNHQNVQPSQEAIEAQKARIEQQKLTWLKQHEDKARKSGFTKWIFLGILLTLLLLVAGILFAKDYILKGIDYIDSLMPKSSQTLLNQNNSVIEETEIYLPEIEEIDDEDTEEVDPIQTYYDKVDEITDSENDQETKVEQLRNLLTEVVQENEEPDRELTQYISQKIMNLTINSEEPQDEESVEEEKASEEEIEEDSESSDKTEVEENEPAENIQAVQEETDDETVDNTKSDKELEEIVEEESEEKYTITHVDSEEEANWVLPAHCSDLTCYGEDKEFVRCTSFKMVENLEENAHRIWNGWGCRYKDASELVYVEFK